MIVLGAAPLAPHIGHKIVVENGSEDGRTRAVCSDCRRVLVVVNEKDEWYRKENGNG